MQYARLWTASLATYLNIVRARMTKNSKKIKSSIIFAFAQEHQIIGGYLLDCEDSFEELDAAVVTDAKRKDKNLDGKGMRFPVFVKSSYSRENSDSPLTKWKYNIGMTVIGKILD